jgi:valyl-tRNA synthetase
VAANLLWVFERVLALAHPMLPFVTEEIWGYLPGERDRLVVSAFPVADESLLDAEAERELVDSIALTRSVRRWRDLVGAPAASVLPARAAGAPPHELVARLARLRFDADGGEALASIGSIEIVASEEIDAEEAGRRIEERRAKLRGEVERAERKLANDGFVAKAPQDVVDAEREKLDAYRTELEELG